MNKSIIKVISSGSKGNCYLLFDKKGDCLILECGVSIKEIKKALNFDMSNVKGCLISHKHSDHMDKRTLESLLGMCISVYSNEEVHDISKDVLIAKKGTKIGSFKIYPFKLKHNAQNYGYIIKFDDIKICFATDCVSIPYKFKNGKITNYLVEANYQDNVVLDNFCKDNSMRSSFENHQSIENCEKFLVNNFDGFCRNICLIHLSYSNSDANSFVKKIKDRLSFDNVIYADSGIEIPLCCQL